jgi:hypothetical protein
VEVLDKTIEEDVHELILFALKTRDERKLTGKKVKGEEDLDRGLGAKLEEFLISSGFMLRLSLLDSSGKIIAEASNPEKKAEGIKELKRLIFEVLNT